MGEEDSIFYQAKDRIFFRLFLLTIPAQYMQHICSITCFVAFHPHKKKNLFPEFLFNDYIFDYCPFSVFLYIKGDSLTSF
jgi:hypothetical protein